MDFSVINVALVAKLLLLLLIGMGPKIALVPFLEKTKHFDAETQKAIGRRMVAIAVITALILFAFGALLMRLLHISGGAVAVAGGIILTILAIDMVVGHGKKWRIFRLSRIHGRSPSTPWRYRIFSILWVSRF
jgi:multiple antibiotic resistance protein